MTAADGAVGRAEGDLLEALRLHAEAFPVPHPSWHRYVPAMRACLADLAIGLELAAELPEVLELVERALDGELEEAFDRAAAPTLRAAYARLGGLPIPAGEHPYVDEIVTTLEAMEALLVAVSLVPSATRRFDLRAKGLPRI